MPLKGRVGLSDRTGGTALRAVVTPAEDAAEGRRPAQPQPAAYCAKLVFGSSILRIFDVTVGPSSSTRESCRI